jgi:hypothetical protein
MVIWLLFQEPETPAGNPEKIAPEAPVVVYKMAFIGALMQAVWLSEPEGEERVMVLFGEMSMVPEAVAAGLLQPPVVVTV